MRFAHRPKSQKLHICTLSTPRGSSLSLFRSRGRSFQDTGRFLKLPYLAMKPAHWPKFQKLHNAHIHSFYLRGSKLSLFLLYRQRFPTNWPIFKILIFGHETWPVAKVPEVAHILSFYSEGTTQSLGKPLSDIRHS